MVAFFLNILGIFVTQVGMLPPSLHSFPTPEDDTMPLNQMGMHLRTFGVETAAITEELVSQWPNCVSFPSAEL